MASTVDSQIPLQAQMPQFMTPMQAQGQVANLRDLQAQTQLKQQQVKEGMNTLADQQRIAGLYQDKSNLDPETGLPTMEALMKSGASPGVIQKLNQAQLEAKAKKTLNDFHQSETAKNTQKVKEDAVQKVREDSMAEYAAHSDKGSEAAKSAGQKVFSDGIEKLKKSGMFSEQEAGSMPTEFNPQQVQARLLGYKESLAMKMKEDADKRADKKENESERHNRAVEGHMANTEARLASAASGGGSGEVTQPEKDLVVAAWIQNPASLRGMDKAMQRNVVKWAAEKGIKPEDVIAGRAQAKFDLSSAVTAGHRAGAMATVEAAMPDLLSAARETSKAVPREKFVPFNKLMQMSNDSISDPNLLDLKLANQAVASEYQTVIARGGSNVTSLKEAMSLLQTATSQEAYDRALSRVEKEVKINTDASKKVRSDIGGKPEPAKPAAPSDADKAAVAWAKANPTDPRAKKIMEHNNGL